MAEQKPSYRTGRLANILQEQNQHPTSCLCSRCRGSLLFRMNETVRPPNDERYMQLFTPRKPKTEWNARNKQRIEKLTAEGLRKRTLGKD